MPDDLTQQLGRLEAMLAEVDNLPEWDGAANVMMELAPHLLKVVRAAEAGLQALYTCDPMKECGLTGAGDTGFDMTFNPGEVKGATEAIEKALAQLRAAMGEQMKGGDA